MRKKFLSGMVICLSAWLALVLAQFPWNTGGPVQSASSTKFYESAYTPQDEQRYQEIAEKAAKEMDVDGNVKRFVREFDLEHKRVLDVGAGRGYLQDVVDDYTGLDISSSAARFFHKPFVLGSATKMPFRDAEFDAVWSIWVLEHVPDPERMLDEMRRVVKPRGLIYLQAAWRCSPWAADGYHSRPYRDFGIAGKLVKASLPLQESRPFHGAYLLPIRVLRAAAAQTGPIRLHYRLLEPNYSHYWEADSDAINSIDYYETELWYKSRGDAVERRKDVLIIRKQP